MILNKLPKELQEYVKGLVTNESFQFYFAHDPVLDDFFDQEKKFNEKIDALIDFIPSEKTVEIELLKKMKEENASSIRKKMDERISNLLVEYMVLHGKVKAEDFDDILKLILPREG